jgi:4-amino-4-deoxy-L-arabinose transferase-like glycosyltransferase
MWPPATALAVALCALVFVTLGDYGITWDEPTYASSAISHSAWFRSPRLETIDQFWSPTSEHPPLGGLAGAFIRYVVHRQFGLLDNVASCRLQSLIFVFLGSFALFMLVGESYGRWTAALAATSFILLPRVFADAHFIALDFPTTAVCTAAAWLFWRGLARGRMLPAAILIGLAMLCKVYGHFLYALCLIWFAVHHRQEWLELVRRRAGDRWPRALREWAVLICVPWLIFFVGWPWLWPQPIQRTLDYLVWQAGHSAVPTWYFGRTSVRPPWHYPFVLSAVTIPLPVLLAILPSVSRLRRAAERPFLLFLLVNAFTPLAVVAFLTPCKYDGVRLFLPAFPFLCALAAIGAQEVCTLPRAPWARRAAAAGCGVIFLSAFAFSTLRYHPFQTSYYNELLGGVRGAAAKGFETEYWGNAYGKLIPWLQKHPGVPFWVPINYDSLKMYEDLGILPDLRLTGRAQADYLVLLVRQGRFDKELWRFYRSEKPEYSVMLLGQPLVNVYRLAGPVTPPSER